MKNINDFFNIVKTNILKVKKVHLNAEIPEYMTAGSVAFDVKACEDYIIPCNGTDIVMVRTGLAFEIPDGYEIELRQRSGLSLKFPNYIVNSPGTIDADYRGEIFVAVVNRSLGDWHIKTGDRIAQILFRQVTIAIFQEVDELNKTQRNDGGYGHTGT
jgi:dUTP pyrophosphatase